MNKPLILELKDFTQEIADVVNSHAQAIPFELMADKMEVILSKLREEAGRQYVRAEEAYKKSLTESEE